MLVRQILKSKSGGVTTIAPSATVADAVTMLSARRIGALVVSSDGARAEGILSERDIVRELGLSGGACLAARVDQVMTPDPVACLPGDTVDAVLQKMTDGRFRHLPVVEGGRMVGLISIGDAVKARLDELHVEKDALEGMIKGF